jgi:HK97 family phage portal protein
MQVSTVWACVTLLVETISSLPLMVYGKDAQGNRVTSTDRIAKILHDAPNQRQTSQEFWEQMLLNYFLRGNAYARIQRDSRGAALSLWPLSADQIDVVMTAILKTPTAKKKSFFWKTIYCISKGRAMG